MASGYRETVWLGAGFSGVTGALVSLGWNAASSGLAVDHVGLRSFGLYGGGLTGAAPPFPAVAGQFYVAVLVAGLVSAFIADRQGR